MTREIEVYEDDHEVAAREAETSDVSSYNMFRAKFADVFENNAILTSTVARIETTISTAQERLYGQMEEMAKSLKEIAIVSNDLQRLQVQMDREQQELIELKTSDSESGRLLLRMSDQIDEVKSSVKEYRLSAMFKMIIISLNFIMITLFILHMLKT